MAQVGKNETRNGAIGTFSDEARSFDPPAEFVANARIRSMGEYKRLYAESLESPDTFWKRETADLVFREPWTELLEWKVPHAKWFVGAKLNITESCLDQHLRTDVRDKAALVWEGEPGENSSMTYAELHEEVVRFAAALSKLGVQAGDRVAIYMGMVPEAVIGILACARIGAPHTVVFGGFAPDSLRDRINDCDATVVLTQDGAWRRGRPLPLKSVVDEALEGAPGVKKVVVFQRMADSEIAFEMKPGRDVDWYAAVADASEDAAADATRTPEAFDAEHPLFILYTSGSTGKPKGILHTTAGYLVGTHVTSKYVFDLKPDDVYWCTADVGWITGHSYIVYGPLSNGATCVLYEGAPNFPDWGRFWQIIDRHKVSVLYTAPTAIRAFIRAGDDWVNQADLSSLRLLGTVGEPINPEAWIWYHKTVGKERCPIVDTWWQTETGAMMLTTLPGAMPARPGAAGLPFFGVKPEIVTGDGVKVDGTDGGFLVIREPWPSMLRSLWGDDERYREQYWTEVPGNYFTGDGAHLDEKGYFVVVGRIDDVLNVSGHRIGTAEIESCLVAHESVAEAAAVGRPDDLKGQALVAFVTLKTGFEANDKMKQTLRGHVSKHIGKFAHPDDIRFADALPKTRSGKIMRRLLKDIAEDKETTQDVSTLEDPNVLVQLRGG